MQILSLFTKAYGKRRAQMDAKKGPRPDMPWFHFQCDMGGSSVMLTVDEAFSAGFDKQMEAESSKKAAKKKPAAKKAVTKKVVSK